MKKILYYFPFNPIEKKDGSKTRAFELLKYFKEKGFEIDFVYEKNLDNTVKHDEQILAEKLVNNIVSIQRRPNTISFSYVIYKIDKIFFKKKTDITNFFFRKQFDKILEANTYDYVIISYAIYANLISNKKLLKGAITINDTHDFLTSQIQDKKKNKIGEYFQNEIKMLDKFDQVWAISNDECYIFNQFIKNVKLVPFSPTLNLDYTFSKTKRTFDIIYVASENPHNIKSAKWFFEKVYPLLDQNFKILIIGKICKHVLDYKNVVKINFVEDLSTEYLNSKISICPMLTGTGVKIKVLEALSFGLPIVTNLRGVDGLVNKNKNGCIVCDDEIHFAENISNLLNDEVFFYEKSKEALDFFNTNYSHSVIYKNLDTIFSQ